MPKFREWDSTGNHWNLSWGHRNHVRQWIYFSWSKRCRLLPSTSIRLLHSRFHRTEWSRAVQHTDSLRHLRTSRLKKSSLDESPRWSIWWDKGNGQKVQDPVFDQPRQSNWNGIWLLVAIWNSQLVYVQKYTSHRKRNLCAKPIWQYIRC